MTDRSEALDRSQADNASRNRGFVLHRFGDADAAEMRDVAMPQPEDDEVVVRVAAASVNPVDYKIRDGEAPFVKQEELPIVLGRDIAGTIWTKGTRAHYMVREGDRILAHLGDMTRGGQARFVKVKATEMTAVPEGVDMVEAAAMPLVAMTAWQGLFDHGRLEPGQTVLIHGGAGGVGHVAVQLAAAHGATVIATASADDLDFVRSLGANRAIDYKNERFEEQVSDVDLVLDLIGGETCNRSWGVLRRGGALITSLSEPDADKAAEHGVRAESYLAHPDPKQLGEVAAMMAKGELKVAVADTFPLEDARRAYDAAEHGHPRGKIVLTMD